MKRIGIGLSDFKHLIEEDLEKEAKQVIDQIISKKYDISLKERGIKDITFIGVAFCRKLVKVSYQ